MATATELPAMESDMHVDEIGDNPLALEEAANASQDQAATAIATTAAADDALVVAEDGEDGGKKHKHKHKHKHKDKDKDKDKDGDDKDDKKKKKRKHKKHKKKDGADEGALVVAEEKAEEPEDEGVDEFEVMFGIPHSRRTVRNIQPVLADERAYTAEGLWTVKASATVEEGANRGPATPCYVTGEVFLMQLRDLYKLTFKDLRLVWRVEHESKDILDDDGNIVERVKEVNARVFVTKKKAKNRMTNLEESATRVPFKMDDGYVFASNDSWFNFDVPLRDVPRPGDFKGVVIAKPMEESPYSDEPIVFGFARFNFQAPKVGESKVVLGMAADADQVKRMAVRANQVGPDARKGGAHRVQNQSYYTRNALQAWFALGELSEDHEIGFEEFKEALEKIDIVILEPRAMRLFRACDIKKDGKVSLTDFEIGLMMNDYLPNFGNTLMDVFHMFDLEHASEDRKDASDMSIQQAYKSLMDDTVIRVEGFEQILMAMHVPLPNNMKETDEDYEEKLEELFHHYDKDKSGSITYREMRFAWLDMCDPAVELEKMRLTPITSNWARRFKGPMMKVGKMLAAAVKATNRKRLDFNVTEQELKMLEGFRTVRAQIEKLRREKRIEKDAKKRKKAAKLGGSALKQKRDVALRKKEKQAQIKKEQKERAVKRQEEKLLANRLAAEQAKAKQRREEEIRAASKLTEAERLADIRQKGLDKMDMSYNKMMEIPKSLFHGRDAQDRIGNLVWADFSNNKIEAIPEGFLFWFSSIRSITFASNRLSCLPSETENLATLEILDISNNELVRLPPEIGRLVKLKHFMCAHNHFERLPDEIGDCVSLELLVVHSNKLTHLPHTIGHLAALERFDLRGNQIIELPEEFADLVSLTKLDLLGNRLPYLPEKLGQCCQMKLYDMGANEIAVAPDSMENFEEMEMCSMRENQLQELGDYISGWRAVIQIDCCHNKIHHISSGIGNCASLQSLLMTDNCLEELPEEVGLAVGLQELQLSTNRIATLPPEVGSLTILHTLNLSRNRLEGELVPEIGLLVTLKDLDLSYNKVNRLPNSIGGLTELITFDISKNQLSGIPENLHHLQNLVEFRLDSNRIKRVPYTLAELSGMRQLDLSNNAIEYIPENMDGWSRLEKLDLTHNFLRALPIDFAILTKDVDVIVKRNPIHDLPNKWNENFTPGAVHHTPFGYSDQQVITWVREQRWFYYKCVEEWSETGVYHYDGKFTFDAFMKAVRTRCGYEWRERFRPEVRRFYFIAKENGVAPTYHLLTRDDEDEKKRVEQLGRERREERFQKAKDEHLRMLAEQSKKYDGELPAKVVSKQVEIFQRGNRKGKLAEQMAEGINATIREQYEERRQKDLLDSAEAEVQKLDEMQRLMGYLHEKKSHQWADYRATDEAEFAMLKKGAEADKLFLRELSKEQFH